MNSIFSSSGIESFQKWKCKRRRKCNENSAYVIDSDKAVRT